MDSNEVEAGPTRRRRLGPIGLAVGGLLVGGILAGTQVASAQDATTPSTTAAAPGSSGRDPASPDHGPNETLLTDGTANQVEAAALDAVPGATVIRVETDSEGSAYEAHLQQDDGSIVTVKVDKDFNVTSTVSGFCGRLGSASPGTSAA
jgi:hypothetical protein